MQLCGQGFKRSETGSNSNKGLYNVFKAVYWFDVWWHYSPCSDPCGSCSSPNPRTPGAPPQPGQRHTWTQSLTLTHTLLSLFNCWIEWELQLRPQQFSSPQFSSVVPSCHSELMAQWSLSSSLTSIPEWLWKVRKQAQEKFGPPKPPNSNNKAITACVTQSTSFWLIPRHPFVVLARLQLWTCITYAEVQHEPAWSHSFLCPSISLGIL